MSKLNSKSANKSSSNPVKNLEAQFAEYVSWKRRKFNLAELGIHADLRELGGTDLQKAVWLELLNIPYGKAISYEELAKRVGNPKAVRAVASAVGDNPLCIIIPCHRVLPKGSVAKLEKIEQLKQMPSRPVKISIGGYALGPELKEALLKLEGVI
jgi:O-6-methylguanine DNA methyltransferase